MITSLVFAALVSGPALEHCRLGALVFTSEKNGVVGDACGSLFVTRDGGLSWEKRPSLVIGERTLNHLATGAVLGDGTVLLAGYLGRKVLRSVDSGATWKAIPTPSDQWVYSFDHHGRSVWTCGSDGQVVRSVDSGLTWTHTKSAGTTTTDRCISLSLIDEKNVWVAGWYGHVFQSTDGGETWSAVTLPPSVAHGKTEERTLDALVRFDRDLAWLRGPSGTFRTRDGGKTWSRVEMDETSPLRVASLRGGRRLLVTARSFDAGPSGWEPRLDLEPVAHGDGAAWFEDHSLVFMDARGQRRVGRLTGPASGEGPLPETVRTFGTMKTGFRAARAFVSEDEGATWRELSQLPEAAPFAELVLLNEVTTLARSTKGALFRARLDAQAWDASTNVTLDAADLARLTGANVVEPLKCLTSGSTGTLAVEFGAQGCFGGDTNSLRLSWNAAGGDLDVTLDDLRREPDPPRRRLTTDSVRARLEQVRALALRPEGPSSCTTTTAHIVSLDVQCELEGRSVREQLRFTTNDCDRRRPLAPGVGGATSFGGPPDGYARALGLHDWALETAKH
jgi:photosystem II stability/assembly factor-like uncharacterized protein